jgi:hypothetical protein
MYQAMSARLSVLEPWQEVDEPEFQLAQSDGLQYELRTSADLKYPIPIAPPPNWPAPVGLAGGWSWPFESANILNAVLLKRLSFDSAVSRLYFSPLGGWGHEKASFDRGLTTIYTEVSMGRASSITLERIGRISVFWNRAKHVIVYQRTVAASRQFSDEQETFRGNPILRKVDEYVELIESDRAFPDKTAPSHSRGFVLGCVFPDGKPPRIHVNSRWGQDLGTTGWRVPLWIRGAGPADVYPKPHVVLRIAGESDDVTCPAAVDDPEKLFFYTSTDPSLSSDTDQWPPVQGVDFEFIDYTATPPNTTASSDPSDFGKSPDFPIQPGSGTFTFRLEPGAGLTNVVRDRTSQPVLARMENVTAMRAVAKATGANSRPPNLLLAQQLRDHASNTFSPVTSMIATGQAAPAAIQKLRDNAAFFDQQLKNVSVDVLKGENLCAEVTRRVTSEFQQARIRTRLEYEAIVTGTLSQIRTFLDNAKEEFGGDLKAAAGAIQDGAAAILQDASTAANTIHGSLGEAQSLVSGGKERLVAAIKLSSQRVGTGRCIACGPWPPPKAALDDWRDSLMDSVRQADTAVGEAVRNWAGARMNAAGLLLRDNVSFEIDKLARSAALLQSTSKAADFVKILDSLDQVLQNGPATTLAKLDAWSTALQGDVTGLDSLVQGINSQIANAIAAANGNWGAFEASLQNGLQAYLSNLSAKVDSLLDTVQAGLGASAGKLCSDLLPNACALIKYLQKQLGLDALTKLADQLAGLPAAAIGQLAGELDRFYSSAAGELNHFYERVRGSLPSLPPVVLPGASLQLFRSFGDAPKLPHLDFSLPQSGFYFFDPTQLNLIPQVNLTPLAARANQILGAAGTQLRDLLNPIDLHIPTTQLLDRLIPSNLQNFDLSKVLPNIAGLDLSSLFKSIKVPELASDKVKVTHGIDAASHSAWLEMSVDISLTDPATIFSLAGVTLTLLRASFQGLTRIDASAGQAPKRQVKGSITGDWSIQVGGMPIAQLVDCKLHFEEGVGIGFDITPDKVRLEQTLAFISDLLSSLSASDGGFSFGLTPTGIRTTLSLPLPDIEAGAFGISNLSLGFFFELAFLAQDFTIHTGLNVASRTAPFGLTVFILGGAGYLETDISYTPRTGALTAHVSIGIFAEASLAIALGPIKGGIYAYFGITVDYFGSNQQPSSLTFGLLLLFRGEVSLLGFISVSLCVSLEADYQNGGGLTGRGTVSYSIKIGWFFSIDVTVSISYTFGASGQPHVAHAAEAMAIEEPAVAALALNPYQQAAKDYVAMFAA